MIVLRLTMVEGRSAEQKARVIERVSAAAARHFGRVPGEVRLLIVEIPKANWGIGGTSMAAREGGQREREGA